jgi:AcrR family transcriptional regulator
MLSAATRTPRPEVWRALQAAAIALVTERGLAAVTVDDIAAAAGTSRRTFFNYFSTKASSLFDPAPELAEQLDELLAAAPPSAPPWTALRDVCTAFVVASGHERVLPIRRRLVAEFPELRHYHGLAHQHVERSLAAWAHQRCPEEPLQAELLARAATSVLAAAFMAWSPDDGPQGYVRLVERGFDLVTIGTP